MGKPTGFIDYDRIPSPVRDPLTRTRDWNEYNLPMPVVDLQIQAARCMDCGVPFCHTGEEIKNGVSGCPLHNLIPEWNDAVYRGEWREALDLLLKTNNFPEFTGRVCPAPCEGSCTVAISEPAVGIKSIEKAIIDRGFEEGWIKAQPPQKRTGKRIAIIGSGPAGLACADQLNKAGHNVTVFEKSDRIGGLLMYGIPTMKLEKDSINRRVNLMAEEGVEFVTNVEAGKDITMAQLKQEYDSIVLATGAGNARDVKLPGRDAKGIYFAVDYLTQSIKDNLDNKGVQTLSAEGKNVIVIGGGDTGADCVATALRQGAKSIYQFGLRDKLPDMRAVQNPWPQFPKVFQMDYAHSEAEAVYGEDPRHYLVSSTEFIKNERGELTGLRTIDVDRVDANRNIQEVPGSEKIWDADIVLIAIGFAGATPSIFEDFQVGKTKSHTIEAAKGFYRTDVEGIFACGDARYGQSLVVTAINEGREAAREVDFYLMGETFLP
ncbi:glutamate synthase subunit beta [Paenilisteria rocourtiae]|uniref:Glutamate synthase (NADPH) small subunit n=1 Tax=Listeria rocourtiae TaxID=647910 RepID=A0A4R6ZIZ5_9LIST|nr:glutamate synthase subunit beta [Listeria rocourtiae]EUJ47679.1 glutamate synthase subunit beta [Listeria rocourtiae FSL F6-920]MBC1435512.1 glutamate synthase subunit beta [Listeria rocourtiae]MBC1604874.1 glutamate synthase subunit beta [Listeria rocourtiae]TDR51984.1 glutamate synthase (NADPH) small subunit [Listeria rocourtiae]